MGGRPGREDSIGLAAGCYAAIRGSPGATAASEGGFQLVAQATLKLLKLRKLGI